MFFSLLDSQFRARLRIVPAIGACLFFGLCGSNTLVQAVDPEDRRALDHTDYDRWNSLQSQNLSNDGAWVSYIVQPGKGQGKLVVREIASAKQYTIDRASSARFSFDSQYLAYIVSPDADEVKEIQKANRKAKNKRELPKSHLEVLTLATGQRAAVESVSRFSMPTKGSGWIAFQISADGPSKLAAGQSDLSMTYKITPEGLTLTEEKNSKSKTVEKPEPAKSKAASTNTAKAKSKSKSSDDSEPPAQHDKDPGTTLVLRHLAEGSEWRIPYVDNYQFSEQGRFLAYTISKPDAEDGVVIRDLKTHKSKTILSGAGEYGRLAFSKSGKHLAFLTNRDDYHAGEPDWSLYLHVIGSKSSTCVVDSKAAEIPAGWEIASSSSPSFTDDGRRLLFRTRPSPEPEEDDDQEAEEVAKLDLWHWQDPFLQPQQLLLAARERNRSFQAVYDIRRKRMRQLGTKAIQDVSLDPRSSSNFALGVSPNKYNKMRSWDVQGFSDWYLIDLRSGKATSIFKMARGTPQLSPAGKYVYWWDGEKKTWFALSTASIAKGEEPKPRNLASGIGFPVHNELHDQPSLPGSYGSAGWLENDSAFLLYDRWDMWQVDPSGESRPSCVTSGIGRDQEIRFRNVRLDSEQRFVDLGSPLMLSAFMHHNKASGYYRLEPGESGSANLVPLVQWNEQVGSLRKAKQADAVVFTRQTFQRCPDLWASDLNFQTTRRISKVNPQQDEYTWGSAELVDWQSDDGQPLEGLLYKPEGFDPERKYPLLVYFYERNSDNLHRYYAPAAGRSIINFSFYVSRGYVIFVPDIPYTVGEPGPSAAKAVLPGVQHIVDQGYIDPKRIGMQGHSWGGYQTAYLVTVSDMFACAESGAPVSNMTSAYGGIRWGSGMSRMFQYEKTQSRIGGTLWEARDKYIANSPLFFADKVNTPLLILHNDEDTAVPWYQGIELFVALRRLEKPAWMLNYNGDPHWVMSDANRMDFAKRMQQFFDHYLKGDPMPKWMADGIPAVDKGKEFGFEFVPEATEAQGDE